MRVRDINHLQVAIDSLRSSGKVTDTRTLMVLGSWWRRHLLVADRLQPGGAVAVAVTDHDGDVGHEIGVGGAVPVLLAGRALHGLTGADAHDVAVAGADQAHAAGDVQDLA